MKKIIILATIYMLTLTIGCTLSNPTPEPTNEMEFTGNVSNLRLPFSEMNTLLRLSLAGVDENDLKIGSTIILKIENISEEQIWFPVGYNIMPILVTNDNNNFEFTLIENRGIYENWSEKILSPSGQKDSTSVIFVDPFMQNINEPVEIIIAVVGNIFKDGSPTQEEVGAFIQLTLVP